MKLTLANRYQLIKLNIIKELYLRPWELQLGKGRRCGWMSCPGKLKGCGAIERNAGKSHPTSYTGEVAGEESHPHTKPYIIADAELHVIAWQGEL